MELPLDVIGKLWCAQTHRIAEGDAEKNHESGPSRSAELYLSTRLQPQACNRRTRRIAPSCAPARHCVRDDPDAVVESERSNGRWFDTPGDACRRRAAPTGA
jgi:hypothetical protein